MEGKYLNSIKSICKNPTANITLNSERLKASPKMWNKVRMSTFLFNRVLEVLTTSIRQEIETKGVQIKTVYFHIIWLFR